ncbi:MAG: hypothetical protein DCC68_22750, partial [Planctomycetota bacterium]
LAGSPVIVRDDAIIDFNWGTAAPDPRLPADRFSVRWTGKIETLGVAGQYRFDIISNDGIRVWVNNLTTPIIDRWLLNSQFANATIPLEANTKYDIKVEYFENTLTSNVSVRWTPPGGTLAPIPAAQFSQSVDVETTPPQIADIRVASSAWTSAFESELAAQGWGDSGVDVPVGGTTAVLPWSNLNQVSVRFDSDVLAAADSLVVNGVNVASYGIADFSYDYTTFTGTWTLAEPIALDRATISLAGVTDIVGNSLPALPTTTIRSAAGDVDGNGTIAAADRTAVVARAFTGIGHASYSLRHDTNGDGYINTHDLVLLQQAEAQPLAARRAVRAEAAVRHESAARRIAVDRALAAVSDSASQPGQTAELRARRLARTSLRLVDAALDSPTQ